MARFEFRLPDIGEGIAEAEIVAWHVKVGDTVEEDQQLADLMTDRRRWKWKRRSRAR
jgi:2-oxoisovalerate dehydrogenase E2 component (dihydrolipoyl transacylase)